jgi:hypothetical protein
MGLLILLLVLNFAISTWNAWIVGKVWDACQGAFEKMLLWCAIIQSVIGYSSVAIVGIALAGYGAGWIDLKIVEQMVSLWYLLIIIPVISTGFVIWLHSVVDFLRRPTLTGGMAAGWNTYAQLSNMAGAFREIPNAFSQVRELFSSLWEESEGEKKDAWLPLAVAGAVCLSLLIGGLLTLLVFNFSRRRVLRETRHTRTVSA